MKRDASGPPILTIVVPCYNEEPVLTETAQRLSSLLDDLLRQGLVRQGSSAIFVDDGSRDRTWALIESLSREWPNLSGTKLSRNRGHQNALLAGLLTSPGDVLVSIDADLQDDMAVIPEMLKAYKDGSDIVLGVRSARTVDSFFKRSTAELYYEVMRFLGVDIVHNHADFRLMSRQAIEVLREYPEVNLFLRGIIPLIGLRTSIVHYERLERFAGESKYPLRRMLSFAFEGLTSFSSKPLRFITYLGFLTFAATTLGSIWVFVVAVFMDRGVPGWASTVLPLYFLGGIQLFSLGVIGEYIGKMYLETKRRPRFTIETHLGEHVAPSVETRPRVVESLKRHG